MMQNWIFSSLQILFMILGVTVIRRENIKEVFIEIFGENHRVAIENAVLFDTLASLIIVSFIPIFNVFYLFMYLIYGFADKNGEMIQLLKKAHQDSEDDRNGKGI